MKNKTVAASLLYLAGFLAAQNIQAQNAQAQDSETSAASTAATAATTPATTPAPLKKKAKVKKTAVSASKKTDAAPADETPKVDADKKAATVLPPPAATAPVESRGEVPAQTAAQAEEANNRQKTLEGSQSPLSIQGNISYAGSSIKHPFSSHAPNPTNRPQPPPVQLGGTISGRYRLDKATTVGLGTGIQLDKPFQNPENFNISDPNADIAHSYTLGKVHNRVDFLVNLYTDHLYHSAGYRSGYSLSNDGQIHWASGFTLGLVLEVDVNSFGGKKDQGSQVLYDLVTDPYVEYQLTKNLNLRSVVGIIHDNIRSGDGFTYKRERIYQTLGLGIQAMDALFLYTFVEFTPFSHFTASNSIVGFNAIVNLF